MGNWKSGEFAEFSKFNKDIVRAFFRGENKTYGDLEVMRVSASDFRMLLNGDVIAKHIRSSGDTYVRLPFGDAFRHGDDTVRCLNELLAQFGLRIDIEKTDVFVTEQYAGQLLNEVKWENPHVMINVDAFVKDID